jgi:hypothetical protein
VTFASGDAKGLALTDFQISVAQLFFSLPATSLTSWNSQGTSPKMTSRNSPPKSIPASTIGYCGDAPQPHPVH